MKAPFWLGIVFVILSAFPDGARREVNVTSRWLHFPVKTGAPKRMVTVADDYRFEIELAGSEPDWWAPLDVSRWKGRSVLIAVQGLPEKSKVLESLRAGDEIIGTDVLYRERLRPQYHFSPRRGWNNDPNGLVFYQGEYHLFFQHNPFGWNWGNMHWGHATSRDLVHWREHGDVLCPDSMGPMFSGSAVVDWRNTSGFGEPGRPPVVLIYTAAGNPATQCLAWSLDGRTFTKYAGNPVVRQIAAGNRDPKVFWHEPSKKWAMVLYVGFPQPAKPEAGIKPVRRDTVHILTSPDLKNWSVTDRVEGFYECPDLFELAVDGAPAAQNKWVLTAANSDYMVGTFNGASFHPETGILKGQSGRGFYAAQTYSDAPDGRRIQIGWLQAPSPGMPFNQAMSLPMTLALRATPEGPRLAWDPVRELNSLRASSTRRGPVDLVEGASESFGGATGELLELRAEFEPGQAGKVGLVVRGVPITYDAALQVLNVNGHAVAAPKHAGRQNLAVYADRTSFEVFASDGLVYVPMPLIAASGETGARVSVTGGSIRFSVLDLYELHSSW